MKLLPIKAKRFFQLLTVYSGICVLATVFAILFRWDFAPPPLIWERAVFFLLAALPLKIGLLYLFGQFHGLLSHFRFPDLERLVCAMGVASVVMLGLQFIGDTFRISRGAVLIDFILCLGMFSVFRITVRRYRERYSDGHRRNIPRSQKAVVLVGAGEVGGALCSEYLSKRYLGIRPIAFFDDDLSKQGQYLHGVPVVGSPEELPDFCATTSVDSIIITMPSAPKRRIGDILKLARRQNIKAEIVPALHQIVSGQAKISQIRPVDIEDLLGRDLVQLNTSAISGTISGKVVFVTGAGGTIGGELARQVLINRPEVLVLIDHSESALFLIEQELLGIEHDCEIFACVANVGTEVSMRRLFSKYRPQLVFHAAAYKHVPMMESQPGQAIINNAVATYRLALVASEFEVERFTLVSTDKAINPTSVMGATKRLAEIAVQGVLRKSGNKTRFIAVRFGNVLGSSGSVIPTFRRQIAAGGPVTVTHPETTRYFMTVSEAVGLILQSAVMGRGGEIFVLNMGKPVSIVQVARNLIELSGFEPGEDIQIEFIGLRPGEKLHEELELKGERFEATLHPRVVRYLTDLPPAFKQVSAMVRELEEEATTRTSDPKSLIGKYVPEYTPWKDNQPVPFSLKQGAATESDPVDDTVSLSTS